MSKLSLKKIAEGINEVLEDKSTSKIDATLKNIVEYLHKNRLLKDSNKILGELEKIINKKTGTIKVKIHHAKHLTENYKKTLEHEIKTKYKAKHIESEYFENKDLLGGVKVEVGEEIWDNTYRNKINQLRKHLIQK